MRTVDIIARKRDGHELSDDEIRFFIRGDTAGDVPDYQAAALLMAICTRGMTVAETTALCREMLSSGEVLDFGYLGRPRVDKHSTGGVGDKTSLVVAPVVAAAGVPVPMISGRGLAHSGGTLDKLESIPGFRTDLSLAEFRAQMERIGVSLIGQTREIAPADRKLYALRDVTGTVPCIPLMVGSILSKKLAEGISGLVLDVKVGSGAFLRTVEKARSLALLMIQIAGEMGKRCVALLTDMDQPLGRAVGNSIEVIEAFEALKGDGPEDLRSLCRELSAHMLMLGDAVDDLEEGRETYDRLIASGDALEKMRAIIEAQGGDARVIDDYARLPGSADRVSVRATASGFVSAIDASAVGTASMVLGAGRVHLYSQIDHGVGAMVRAQLGDRVSTGDELVSLHVNDTSRLDEALDLVNRAFIISEEPVEPTVGVKEVLEQA